VDKKIDEKMLNPNFKKRVDNIDILWVNRVRLLLFDTRREFNQEIQNQPVKNTKVIDFSK
jgi:hypothetical protein